MTISTLPPSPAGEITHNTVRSKINEVIELSNKAQSIVYVASDSDLPALTGSYSELAANTLYYFQNGASITKPLMISVEGVTLYGTGPFGSGVQFSGALPFLTIDNVSVSWLFLSVNSNTASMFFDATGTGTNTFYSVAMNLEGSSPIGNINGISPVFRDLVAVGFSGGIKFSSAASIIRGLSLVNAFMVDDITSGAIHLDIDDAVFSDFELTGVLMDGAGTCISTSVGGSANLVAELEADVTGCSFGSGFMTALTGFDDDWQTNQWKFGGNSPLNVTEPTKYEADCYLLEENQVDINSSGVFSEIGPPSSGSFQSDLAKHFVLTPDGALTYTGDRAIDVQIIGSSTVDKQGGGSDTIEVRIAINWTPGSSGLEKSKGATKNTQETAVTCMALTTLVNGDNVRLIYANMEGTSDINVFSNKLIITGR